MPSIAPRVSVVIPCYNAVAFVSEALNSVLAQSYRGFEVLVINDGSPDTPELERVLEPFLTRIQYIRQANMGPGGARNSGLLQARGEYVAFLDSDDAWEPSFLAEQMRILENDPALDLVYADALLVGETPFAGLTYMETNPSEGEVTFASLMRLQCSVITSCVIARRSALMDAGMFDCRFYHSEDFDLWLRLAHRGSRIWYHKRVLARHRVHPQSLGAQPGALLRAQIEISTKLLTDLDLSDTDELLLREHAEWCAAHLALDQGKQDLLAGRYPEATIALKEASGTLRSGKLRCAVIAARFAPRLLHWLCERRRSARARPDIIGEAL